MKLIKELILLPAGYSITAEVEEARNAIALKGHSIKTVTSAETNEQAGAVVREIRKYVKDVESLRVSLTKPLLDGQRLLKSLSDDHCAPLIAEQQRIEKLATDFMVAEQRRVAAAEEVRRVAFEKAEATRIAAEEAARKAAERMTTDAGLAKSKKLEAKAVAAAVAVQTIIAAPLPEGQRTKGQTFKKVLKWEVTDLNALVKARPDLCKIEAKASAIQATCVPEMPNLPLGLKLWWENQSVFTSR